MTIHVTDIVSTHYCRPCKFEFVHYWKSKPWFGDYSRSCPRCKRNAGFKGTRDFSFDKQEDWEKRWDRRE